MALSPALRKVAVLVSALDADAADAVLAQVGVEDAAKIRSALVELDDISSDEQQEVLAAFLNAQGTPNASPIGATENVTLELNQIVEDSVATESRGAMRGP